MILLPIVNANFFFLTINIKQERVDTTLSSHYHIMNYDCSVEGQYLSKPVEVFEGDVVRDVATAYVREHGRCGGSDGGVLPYLCALNASRVTICKFTPNKQSCAGLTLPSLPAPVLRSWRGPSSRHCEHTEQSNQSTSRL